MSFSFKIICLKLIILTKQAYLQANSQTWKQANSQAQQANYL